MQTKRNKDRQAEEDGEEEGTRKGAEKRRGKHCMEETIWRVQKKKSTAKLKLD